MKTQELKINNSLSFVWESELFIFETGSLKRENVFYGHFHYLLSAFYSIIVEKIQSEN